jgi:hypothetical protein
MIRPIHHKPAQRDDRVREGDIVLTEADIEELGLEEAPPDLGASWEEIVDQKNRSRGHG